MCQAAYARPCMPLTLLCIEFNITHDINIISAGAQLVFRRTEGYGLLQFTTVACHGDQYSFGLASHLPGQADASHRFSVFPPQQCVMGNLGVARRSIRGSRSPVGPGNNQYPRSSKDRLNNPEQAHRHILSAIPPVRYFRIRNPLSLSVLFPAITITSSLCAAEFPHGIPR